ncbi:MULTISPECIES: MFS transporter [Pseudomonas]|jgi:predicted MFS family arabinose efflux permease|uniref:MFS transporter n=2 Tax=Pseudomonas TaxID=286 RepID=A0A4Y9TA11_PSEFL|nr:MULTISPECIES: MFS transporter [Pseudomonas]CRM91740.1 Purine ribonucleoside efflux pump NepI [Pseudomonas sp. 22 E 5]MCX9153930.1 MFS transporter [Pseudomonas sp. TB1-B1]QXH65565.1 MFS transporter [Pseudomonas asgharzadehiana]TFW41235.1 MFS transporter [Pseudomonas fluorescens]TKJ65510.1 MFS transporter [Pseudomonas sp. CFBP13506]
MSANPLVTEIGTTAPRETLPLGGLLALACAGFITILTEAMPAGLLPQMGQGLGVSPALVGQLVTLYALGSLLAAIPLTLLTRGWRRRPLLLMAIGGFAVVNSVTAFSSHYGLTLVARFFAGVFAGLLWALLAGYASRMVAPHLQGRAIAVAMLGAPLALCLGLPAGTWLGTIVGWRLSFAIMTGLTLVLLIWARWQLPDFAGQAAQKRLRLHQVLTLPGIRSVLWVTFTYVLAHNILYTYVAPLLEPAGIAADIDRVLLVFGLAALLSIWLAGVLINRWLRTLLLISCALFGMIALALALWIEVPTVIYLAVVFWGLAFGGLPALLQTALAQSAGESADAAQSMLVTVWNLGIAGGGLAGGVLLQGWGVATFPWAIVLLMLLALAGASQVGVQRT